MGKKLAATVIVLAGLASFKGASIYDAFRASPAQAKAAEEAAPETVAESEPVEQSGAEAAPATPEELLVAIAMERDRLAQRKQQLDEREATIALAQSTLDAKAAELTALKNELDHLLSRSVRENTDDVARLVEIYKAMKPVQAATIMNEAGIEVAVLVLSAMEPRNSGPIIALMQPTRARAISTIILERSRLPGDQKLVNITLD
ncbi:MAG: hypothetical protein GYB24_05265 [Rhodobacteraceae bacterium]|nr:hypothetical protein [Paracoccaceae bacterium]